MQTRKFIDNPILIPVIRFMCAIFWTNTAQIYNKLFLFTNSILIHLALVSSLVLGVFNFLIGILWLYIEEQIMGWKSIVTISAVTILEIGFLFIPLFLILGIH